MFIREFFAALYRDWIATVSGLASVVLAVWAALFSPQSATLRRSLWIAFAVCLFIASYRIWVAAHKKYLEEKERNVKPQLEGEIQDLIMMGLTGNDDSQACGVWLRAYIFNSTDCRTGIKNFRFRVETSNQALESLYAEEASIPQTYEDAPTRHSMLRGEIEAKQFRNLADMDKGETITKGEPLVGHLHFRMRRPDFKELDFDEHVTLIATDTFGNDHPLPYQHTPMRPSERIMVPHGKKR